MKSPWHLWAVGIVTAIWHAGGAYDYFAARTDPVGYIAMAPSDMQAGLTQYMQAMPAWAGAAWAFGVWFALLGSLLLLFRTRFAFHAFVISIIGLIVSSIYSYLLAPVNMISMGGTGAALFTLAILAVLLAVTWYARKMIAEGVLS
jgi:hypothetical protein